MFSSFIKADSHIFSHLELVDCWTTAKAADKGIEDGDEGSEREQRKGTKALGS